MARDLRKPVPARTIPTPMSPPPSATGKIGEVSIDRTVASRPQPAATHAGDSRSQYYTYLTKVIQPGQTTPILYNGDRLWAKVTLTLETAGPVQVGQQSSLFPTSNGQGIVLPTGVPVELTIAKGSRIYVASDTISRISVKVEPLPWLEQITGSIRELIGRIV